MRGWPRKILPGRRSRQKWFCSQASLTHGEVIPATSHRLRRPKGCKQPGPPTEEPNPPRINRNWRVPSISKSAQETMQSGTILTTFAFTTIYMLALLTCGNTIIQAADESDNLCENPPLSKIKEERRENIKFIIRYLQTCREDRVVTSERKLTPRWEIAIETAGIFRAEEAIQELLLAVDFKSVNTAMIFQEGKPPSISDKYPATGALIAIGNSAVNPAIWELSLTDDSGRREKLCWVIGKIEGGRTAGLRIEYLINELKRPDDNPYYRTLNQQDLQLQVEQLKASLVTLERLFPDQGSLQSPSVMPTSAGLK